MSPHEIKLGKSYFVRTAHARTLARVLVTSTKVETPFFEGKLENGTIVTFAADDVEAIAPEKPIVTLARLKPDNVFHLANSASKRLAEAGLTRKSDEVLKRIFPSKEARPSYAFALSVVREYCDVVDDRPRSVSAGARAEMEDAAGAIHDPEHGVNTGQ